MEFGVRGSGFELYSGDGNGFKFRVKLMVSLPLANSKRQTRNSEPEFTNLRPLCLCGESLRGEFRLRDGL